MYIIYADQPLYLHFCSLMRFFVVLQEAISQVMPHATATAFECMYSHYLKTSRTEPCYYEQSFSSFLFHTEKVNIKYKSTSLMCSGTFVIMMKSMLIELYEDYIHQSVYTCAFILGKNNNNYQGLCLLS